MVYLADQNVKDVSGRLNIVRGIPLANIRINPSDFFLHSM
jgi:hypothetical protein